MLKLKLTILGLPKTTNAIGRSHWAIKASEAKKWHKLVKAAVGPNKPLAPCQRAKLRCTRYSSRQCDYDGLVSSFKHPIDGLIHAGVIIDDGPEFIGMPEFKQGFASPKKGYIEIEVEEIIEV